MGRFTSVLTLAIVAVLLALIPAMVVCVLKGRLGLFAIGMWTVLPAFVGALLPALPGSAWARWRARVRSQPGGDGRTQLGRR